MVCSAEGCSTNAAARGLCKKHGTKKICSWDNCTSVVVARGRCWKHGGGSKKVCQEEGCTTLAQVRGVCGKHGARGTCKVAGCTTNAASGSYCRKHGGGMKPCSVAGCTTTSVRKGLCTKHGGGRDECVFGGCTNVMKSTKWKTCKAHGGLGYCTYTEPGGGCCGRQMLDACNQVGRELQEAHRQVDARPGCAYFWGVNHVTLYSGVNL